MSHTYKHGCTSFIANSDLSGGITIVNEHGELVVDGEDLLSFVGDQIRQFKISKLDEMDPLDFIYGATHD